ncbi:MAG: hypothetical protein ABFS46_19670 [Myxococcota bacterium]
METIYLWPDQPALSIMVLWLISMIVLWAARTPVLQLLGELGSNVEDGLRGLAQRCGNAAEGLRQRTRSVLLASGMLELQNKMDHEFQRIDSGFSDRLGQYSELHRKLDDTLQKLDADYQQCGESPPEVPGWTSAVQGIVGIPNPGDANVHKVLADVRSSIQKSEKKALQSYKDDTSKRHKILGKMRPTWKEIRGLMTRMKDLVGRAQETTAKVNSYVDEYNRIKKNEQDAARALAYSAAKLFTISVLVMGVALGGAFINFQLIALPMSELVPAGAHMGGVPVSTISALVIVLMEIAVGIFAMDLLGITDLFPKLSTLPTSKRRLVLGVALTGLFFLAAVESSLAILREMIVEADAALKMSLAGGDGPVVQASTSKIPVIGQAVLGFVLPWILAMVAIPLEMLLDSGRHVLADLTALLLDGLGALSRFVAFIWGSLMRTLPKLYDVYVAIPLKIERSLRASEKDSPRNPARKRSGGRAESGLREESLA